jgi:dTDP-4-amino-4,6-dideoxygalactose transaminase
VQRQGSHYKGQKCGTFGDISTLSLTVVKLLQLRGGAIITSSLALKKKAIFLATQAREERIISILKLAIIIE